jgi:hypothetical protein
MLLRKHLIQSDLNECQQCLTKLHQTVVNLQTENQKTTNQVFKDLYLIKYMKMLFRMFKMIKLIRCSSLYQPC